MNIKSEILKALNDTGGNIYDNVTRADRIMVRLMELGVLHDDEEATNVMNISKINNSAPLSHEEIKDYIDGKEDPSMFEILEELGEEPPDILWKTIVRKVKNRGKNAR